MGFIFLAYLCIFVVAAADPLPTPHLSLPCGAPLTGFSGRNGSSHFYGIRFAQAPQGALRWQYALPLPSDCYWSGSLNATVSGFECVQGSGYGTEDCLTLDIITPPGPGPFPVLFWVYGGGNLYGSTQSYSNLTNLAVDMKVVVVASNYRLGGLGFLALKELSLRSPLRTSGNYGLSDLVSALEWTQRNIASFGGDPTAVTLIGQSSGGTNIFGLLAIAATSGRGNPIFRIVRYSEKKIL